MRRVLFLVNPLHAARGNRRALLAHCAAILCAEGIVADMQDTLPGSGATRQAREAIHGGFDTVFACGGDGTFFRVLQGLAGSDIALGLIPLGTGNVLAQNLRLPRDPAQALLAQKGAEPVAIPLGEIICVDAGGEQQAWYFTIAAGVGFHAALMDLSSSGAAKRTLGRAAYYAGGLRLLATHIVPAFSVEVTDSEGVARHFRASELIAARVPRINLWHAEGDLRSTRLQIASVAETTRGGLAHACFHGFLRRNAANSLFGLPCPCYEKALQVVCRADAAPLQVQADGEVIGAGTAIFRMAKERLRLLWPAATHQFTRSPSLDSAGNARHLS